LRLEDIERLVSGGESETLEFKKSTGQLNRAGESLCAFLNSNGGIVIIGVTPQGKIVGQQVSDTTGQDIAEMLKRFDPPAPVEIEHLPLPDPDKKLILLYASPQRESRPFTFDGRPYQRIETTSPVMPQERYQQLLLERMHTRQRWENQTATGVRVEDLDLDEILRTVRTAVSSGRLPDVTVSSPEDVLDRFGLRRDGELLNAAVVLFGTQFLPDYPQCQVRMARFRGRDKTEFLDNRQITGNGFELLEESMIFLRRHLPIAGRVEPGLFERVDEPLFPPIALREALVNAFCHRDYSQAGGSVNLAIYDDRLEIWSDGTLPQGLSVEDLKRDHQSRPRNPLISQVFFNRGLVERWGRGTQKIVELCVRAGYPEPEFVEQAGSMGVRFFPSGYIAPHRIALDLTDRQREILQILSSRGAPLRSIMNELSDPPAKKTVSDDLTRLKHLGLIDSKGHGRGAVWYMRPE
jgi:ATP-dependent DNA helicase RecG